MRFFFVTIALIFLTNCGGTSGNPEDAELSHKTFTESSDNILNPERGFFDWVEADEMTDYNDVRNGGFTLAYAEFLLKDFMGSSISQAFLDNLEGVFSDARDAGIKLVIRFNYSDSDEDEVTDAPLSKILEHIGQIKPVLQANADVIAVMQAGFIGRWGEWHSSTNNLDDDPDAKKAILDTLMDALPSTRMIQVRTPDVKTEYLSNDEPTTTDEAFTDIPKARLGHHNDCFLASDTDYGTYDSDEIEFWKDYIEEDARFVPVGGETCAVNSPRSDCESALEEMARLKWSYINSEYNEDVINNWRTQGCLDEITKRLGYRFVVSDLWWDQTVERGGVLHLIIRLTNEGFAAPFNERPAYIVLDGPGNYQTKLDLDPRRWEGGQIYDLEADVNIPDSAEPGTYQVYLWLPDADDSLSNNPLYSIAMANEDVWDENTGYNLLTEIEVE